MLVLFFAFTLNCFNVFASVASLDSYCDESVFSSPPPTPRALPEVLEVNKSTCSLDGLNLDTCDNSTSAPLQRNETSVFDSDSDSDIFSQHFERINLADSSSSEENGCSASYSILDFGNTGGYDTDSEYSPKQRRTTAVTYSEHLLPLLVKHEDLKTRSCRVTSNFNPSQFFMVAICNNSETPTIKDLIEDFMHQRFFLNTKGIHQFCKVISWHQGTDLYQFSINEEGKKRLKAMYAHLQATKPIIASRFYFDFVKFFNEYP